MAERMMLVCDVCGGSPAELVGIRIKQRNLVKDLCAKHVAELAQGARAPKRGRPAGTGGKKLPGRPKAGDITRRAASKRGGRRKSPTRPADDMASGGRRRATAAKGRRSQTATST
jgi:hypothetical protein